MDVTGFRDPVPSSMMFSSPFRYRAKSSGVFCTVSNEVGGRDEEEDEEEDEDEGDDKGEAIEGPNSRSTSDLMASRMVSFGSFFTEEALS